MLEEGREREDVAGVGLTEVERLIEVADAECEVAQLDMNGRLARRPLLHGWPKRRMGVHLGAAAPRHQSARRSP